MKKVLYITTVSRTINAFLIPHIEMLIKEGYQVDCACCIDMQLDSRLSYLGSKIYNISFSRNPLNLKNLNAFKELINIQKKHHYDIVHVHTPVASVYGRLLKFIFPNLKTIYTAHGFHFHEKSPKSSWIMYYPLEKIMNKWSDITITLNQEDYENVKKHFKNKEVYLMNGVGINLNHYVKTDFESNRKLRYKLGLSDDDFVILMVAELNKNKNQIQLIKAIEILNGKYNNIKALLVSDGCMLEELQHEVNIRNLENHVLFLGHRSDINDLINISNLGVLLSYREGLPRSLLEFIANGRKVIGTKIRGCRDIICDHSVGKLVDVGDYVGTASVIEEYYLQNDTNFEVSNSINQYDINLINKQLLSIYQLLEKEINIE